MYKGTLTLLLPRIRIRLRKKVRLGPEASRREEYCNDLRVGRLSADGKRCCSDFQYSIVAASRRIRPRRPVGATVRQSRKA